MPLLVEVINPDTLTWPAVSLKHVVVVIFNKDIFLVLVINEIHGFIVDMIVVVCFQMWICYDY